MNLVQRKPSKYQADIIDFALNGNGDAFIDAVAGSGKTTTLEMVAKELSGVKKKAVFLAFNKHIASELKNRLQPLGHNVSTIHGVGFSCVKKFLNGKNIQIDDKKYQDIIKNTIREIFADMPGEIDDEYALRTAVYEIFKFCRSSLIDPTNKDGIRGVVKHYDIDISVDFSLDTALAILPHVNKNGENIAVETGVLSYCDMLWLPYVYKLNPWQYEYVLVDEAQDLSQAQFEIALKCRRKGGRMIFVGDERQAIYGFAGSDTQSVQQIIKRTEAKRLPLSVCYRCPTSHIELARKIVSKIEPSPSAQVGEVKEITRDKLLSHVKPNDLILCRTTSPLISTAFEIIRSGRPAKIKGRDIGRGLVNLVKKIEKNVKSLGREFKIEKLPQEIQEYESKILLSLAKTSDDDGLQTQKITDQCSSLKSIFTFSKPKTTKEFISVIESIFSDDRGAVTLSTIHRAKGLEEDRVFILEPDSMPHPLARSKWEREQEMNIKYVALTRSKKELFLVY